MKLLFDQNISFRILKKVLDIYPKSKQVRELCLENATDIEIYNFSKKNHFTIITFDADFFDLSILKGHPPKIIWIRTGNTTTKYLANILRAKKDIINDFLLDSFGCLEITA